MLGVMNTEIRFKDVLRAGMFPLIVFGLLLAFIGVYRLLNLPDSDELVRISEIYLARYGYYIVLAAAFVEAIPPVNFYFPGSAVVVLSVAFARQGTLNVFGVLGVAAGAFLFAYVLDYGVGKYGWSWVLVRCGLGPALERSQARIATHGLRWLWLSYVHPNVGAIAATSCGVLRVPFGRFLFHSALAITPWVVFWGALAFLGGKQVIKLIDVRWLVPVVIIWLVVTLGKRLGARRLVDGRPEGQSSVRPKEKID
jgi:membrane protein DedA with SNARE-associated domain